MEKTGLITRGYANKAKKLLHFADEIISIENIGPDKSLYGRKTEYDRLKVIYKFNGQTQTSTISSKWGAPGKWD